MDSLVTLLRACMHASRVDAPYSSTKFGTIQPPYFRKNSRSAMVPKKVMALIAIYGQLGQLYIAPEYYNQHAGNTATHACSGGTPRGATAVLQGNAGKIEKPSKY